MLVVDHIKTVPTRYGDMAIYDNDLYIGHALTRYGEYSQGEIELWRKIVKPGEIVIDGGANIGVFTLALAELVGPTGKVLAFEPQPTTFQLLERNVRDNDKHGVVQVCDFALSDMRGTYRIPGYEQVVIKNYGGISLLDPKIDPRVGPNFGSEVQVVPLDDHKLQRLDFIKLDIEGMEQQALSGAADTIKRCHPVLYVECDREDKAANLMRFIAALGYTMYWHKPILYSADNFNGAAVEVADSGLMSFMLLCIPAERADEFADATKDLEVVVPPSPSVSTKDSWACIVRLGGIGDDLIAASVLRPLKRMGYKIEVISQLPQCCVYENNPFIDKLTIKDGKKEVPQNDQLAWQKFWWSRSCEYDKFVNLSHSVEVLMAQFPAATAFWWPREFRRKLCGGSYLEAAHDVAGVAHEFGPMFFPTVEERTSIIDLRRRIDPTGTRKLVGWIVQGTRIDKLYPWSGHVVARILAELEADLIMICAPAPHPDASRAEQIVNHVKMTNSTTRGLFEARHVEGKHNWPIRRTLTLAQMCDVVIGPDSGTMWAVCMEPVPKIMLHSHASVNNITKHWKNTISLHADTNTVKCWPCHLLHDGPETCQEEQIKAGLKPSGDDSGAACISSIPVELVVQATKVALTKATATPLQRWGTVVLQHWEHSNGN